MKGIILAGGSATRLYPSTSVVCKQLLPVYDKPMIYYPLSTLMLAGIKDVLIISTPKDLPLFEELLGSGERWGMRFYYTPQAEPRGLAEALIIGEDFTGGEEFCLILGDNIFYGHGFPKLLKEAVGDLESKRVASTIFGYWVGDPTAYGVVEMDSNNKPIAIEEKPAKPKSHWAVTGLYFYNSEAISVAKGLAPSKRGELEITDVNRYFIDKGEMGVKMLGRGVAWLDMGTHDSLLESAAFVSSIEKRQGLKISCVEEIAYRMGYIGLDDLRKLAHPLKKSGYGEYIERIIAQEG
jgi:glucose-1-phosphate thymidylyltransferase